MHSRSSTGRCCRSCAYSFLLLFRYKLTSSQTVSQCDANTVVSPQVINEVSFDVGALGTSTLTLTSTFVIQESVRLVSPSTAVTLRLNTGSLAVNPMFQVDGAAFSSPDRSFQMHGLTVNHFDGTVTSNAALISATNLDSVELSGCHFDGARVRRDTAEIAAGVLFATAVDSVLLSSCSFVNSRALATASSMATLHGALYISMAQEIHVSDCSFSMSTCTHDATSISHSVGSLDAASALTFIGTSVIESLGSHATLVLDCDVVLVEDCVFQDGTTQSGHGGAIEIVGAPDATVRCNTGAECLFSDNDAATDGGAIYVTASNIVLIAADPTHTFNENTALNGAGGAIHVDSSSSIRMEGPWAMTSNVAFSPPTAGGGAVYVDSGSFSFTGAGVFNSNVASLQGRGGAVYATDRIDIDGVKEMIGNMAATGGGAVCSQAGEIHIVNVLGSIDNNDGATLDTGEGGGVALALSNSLVNITMLGSEPGSTLENNQCGTSYSATLGGGVIRTDGDAAIETCLSEQCASMLVADNGSPDGGGVIRAGGIVTALFGPKTSVMSNDALLNGGVIMAFAVEDFTAAIVEGNSAGDSGGVIYSCGTTLISSVAQLHDNHADSPTGRGGAVYSEGKLTITTVGSVSDNTAGLNGGAFFTDDQFQATNLGPLSENHATAGSGGAIHSEDIVQIGSIGDVSSCTAATDGGAIFVGNSAHLTIDSVGMVHDNYAGGKGGALYAGSVTLSEVNGPISLNEAEGEGGAVYAPFAVIVNAGFQNITDNKALEGGAFYSSTFLSVTQVGVVSLNRARVPAPHGTARGGAFWGDFVQISDMGDAVDNRAKTSGGCIFGNDVVVENAGAFKENAAGEGGAIFGQSSVTVTNVTAFNNNDAQTSNGGAISSQGDVFIQAVGAFSTNTAAMFGGAISSFGTSVTTMQIGSFVRNRAFSNIGLGGAIFSGGTIDIDAFNVTDNSAEGGGGGAFYASGMLTVTNLDHAAHNQCNSTLCSGGVGYGLGGVQLGQLGDIQDNGNFGVLGGAFASMGTLSLDYAASFTNNLGRAGGALYATEEITIQAVGSVAGNQVDSQGSGSNGHGGAFYCEEVDCTIRVFSMDTLIANNATNNGGAIAGTHLILDSVGIVAGNMANEGGAFYSTTDMTITLTSGASFNEAMNNGGLAYVGGVGSFNVTGPLFNHTAHTGSGGVIFSSNTVTIAPLGDLFNNTAEIDGGAFSVLTALTIVEGGNFIDNTATIGDGGVLVSNFVSVSNIGDVKWNRAGGSGGAFSSRLGDCSITMVRDLVGNSCGDSGGVIFANNGLALVQNSGIISGNNADSGNGGAISALVVNLTGGSAVTGNRALSGTGGAFHSLNDAILFNFPGPFEDNMAESGGLVFAQVSVVFSMVGDILSNHATAGDGGAVYANGNVVIIRSGAIQHNEANGNGAVIFGADVTLSICGDISENTSQLSGGVIFSGGTVVIEKVGSIEFNSAGIHGGVVFASGGATVTNSVEIEHNRANGTAGVIFACAGVTMTNNGPVRFNSADHNGVAFSGGSVVYDNAAFPFHGNSAVLGSGGIAASFDRDCEPVLSPQSFSLAVGDVTENSGQFGGAFFSNDPITISSIGFVSSNRAAFEGGFLWSSGTVSIGVAGGFHNNSASNSGNIIFSSQLLTLNGPMGDVYANRGDAEGGFACTSFNAFSASFGNIEDNDSSRGAFVSCGGTVTIGSIVSVTNNTAVDGGAIAAGGTVSIGTAGDFTLNRATRHGGAIFTEGDLMITSAVNIIANDAQTSGGFAYVLGATTILSLFDVTDNVAGASGSAIYSEGDLTVAFMGDVAFNSAEECGAFCSRGSLSAAVVGDIRNNTALEGGAFYGEVSLDITEIGDIVGNIATQNVSSGVPTGSGAAIYSGGTIGIAVMGDVLENKAQKGGALYSVGKASLESVGNVRGNLATMSGGFLHAEDAVLITSVMDITENVSPAGGCVYCEGTSGDLRVTSLKGDIEQNSGVFFLDPTGDRELVATFSNSGTTVYLNQGKPFRCCYLGGALLTMLRAAL